jgi:sugar phosphate isomerase/epimerase
VNSPVSIQVRLRTRLLLPWPSPAKDYGLTYSIHPPCKEINPASSDPSERARVIDAYLGTVELATRLGIRDMVVHSGHKSDPDVDLTSAHLILPGRL